jgi:hypothetical protein
MRQKLQFVEVGGYDKLSLEDYGECGLCLEIDEPYAGDTQYGIGRTSAYTLTKEQARQLAAALNAWAEA